MKTQLIELIERWEGRAFHTDILNGIADNLWPGKKSKRLKTEARMLRSLAAELRQEVQAGFKKDEIKSCQQEKSG